jgi:hypothetical protein
MAINVNTVYQTVLSILNKEQRGYMTPDEFNKVATQVQLDIFESYFDTINQQLRVQQANTEYGNRQKSIDERIAPFKQISTPSFVAVGNVLTLSVTSGGTSGGTGYSDSNNVATTTAGSGTGLTVNITTSGGVIQTAAIAFGGGAYSIGDTVTVSGGGGNATLTINSVNTELYFLAPSNLYKLGTIIYNDSVELQKVDRNEYIYLKSSSLTEPSTNFPVYIYERALSGSGGSDIGQTHIYVYPTSITSASDLKISYIRKPASVAWGFTVGTLGQYLYSSSASTQFELLSSEQTEVILRILAYAGIIIQNPQIVQAASQAVQAENINSKS